jgi:hypothetical protein
VNFNDTWAISDKHKILQKFRYLYKEIAICPKCKREVRTKEINTQKGNIKNNIVLSTIDLQITPELK